MAKDKQERHNKKIEEWFCTKEGVPSKLVAFVEKHGSADLKVYFLTNDSAFFVIDFQLFQPFVQGRSFHNIISNNNLALLKYVLSLKFVDEIETVNNFFKTTIQHLPTSILAGIISLVISYMNSIKWVVKKLLAKACALGFKDAFVALFKYEGPGFVCQLLSGPSYLNRCRWKR